MSLKSIIDNTPDSENLWDGKYKIPWDDLEFSRRMLREHLSQDHDLASRKQEIIKAQVEWIHEKLKNSSAMRLLDIGCGPGLYIEQLVKLGYECSGIDFSPASIEYAAGHLGDKAHLVEGDVRSVDFGDGYDMAMMLYGELDVFSPMESKKILQKIHNALKPGGKLLLEVHKFDTVKRCGEAPGSWYKSGKGLTGIFSDDPHICLIENHWFDKQNTSLQVFNVIYADSSEVELYRSTTQARTDDDYKELLLESGFTNPAFHADWPCQSADFAFISAVK